MFDLISHNEIHNNIKANRYSTPFPVPHRPNEKLTFYATLRWSWSPCLGDGWQRGIHQQPITFTPSHVWESDLCGQNNFTLLYIDFGAKSLTMELEAWMICNDYGVMGNDDWMQTLFGILREIRTLITIICALLVQRTLTHWATQAQTRVCRTMEFSHWIFTRDTTMNTFFCKVQVPLFSVHICAWSGSRVTGIMGRRERRARRKCGKDRNEERVRGKEGADIGWRDTVFSVKDGEGEL